MCQLATTVPFECNDPASWVALNEAGAIISEILAVSLIVFGNALTRHGVAPCHRRPLLRVAMGPVSEKIFFLDDYTGLQVDFLQ
jgi:hypothetical protein